MEVSIRDYLEALVDREREVRETEVQAIREAVEKATVAMEGRLDHMNEFRRQIEKAETTYVPRVELRALDEKMDLQIEQVRQDLRPIRQDIVDLRTGRYVTDARLAVVATGIIVAIGAVSGILSFAF